MPKNLCRFLTPLLLVFILPGGLFTGCGSSSGSSGSSPSDGFAMPQALSMLDELGIGYSCHALVSTKPDKKYPLTIDQTVRRCRGEVTVKTGSTFDVTVVFEAGDPISEETVEVARFTKTGLVAVGSSMSVTYDEEEAVYDPTPGQVSSLNLDGDQWSNFDELVYGSDPTDLTSLPSGPRASASRKDILTQNDVSLPEGISITEAFSGEAELKLKLFSPKPITGVKIVDPDFGVTITEIAAKEYSIIINTAEHLISANVQTITLTLEITDSYFTVQRSFSFSVYNPLDRTAPAKVMIGLAKDQLIRDRLTF
ncbi:MAG: hypothetical protein HYT76_08810, partial [Deltaproteobacteria bacterium]|nr:hypothetical protein [Deltaproteobacteria bacterium]